MRKILFILTLLSFASCVEVSGEEKVMEVESMIIQLDSLETKSRELSIENLSEITKWSDTLDTKIRKLFKPVPFNIGKQIVAFTTLKGELSLFNTTDTLISKQLIIQKTQLLNLKTDIENGSGSRGRYDHYISLENTNMKQIEDLINKRDSARIRIISNFNELKSNLDSNLNVILSNE
ncbi:MAG: hypothetical protein ACO2Z9_03960 [Crocinitomicaceae bacterium]